MNWYLLWQKSVQFEKSQKEMAVVLKWCIFDPMLGKPKCTSDMVIYFEIVNKELKNVNNLKKTTTSQTHIGFDNFGLNMHCFSTTAISF